MSQAVQTVDPAPPSAPAAPAQVPGIAPLEPRQERLQRRMVLVATILPFAGFVAAVVTLWGHGLSAVDAAIFAVSYVVTGLGVTVGYHRLFTHRSFEAVAPVRLGLAVAGSMAVEGSIITWVADHRRHHAFADKEGDPHSPHLEVEAGLRGMLRGLWHAHIGWLFAKEKTTAERWAPDLLKEPGISRIDRLFPLWSLLSFTLPALIGLVVTRSLWGAVTAFLWGGLARVFFLHHVTWSINSICHYYGRRPFETTDESTNNWLLSLVSFGESWHNNHHAFPSSAVHGINRWQVDISAGVITLLDKLGLARHVKRVSATQVSRKRN
ncbi:MAG: acyl-CoA desaturase [Actinomycetota bacterium]